MIARLPVATAEDHHNLFMATDGVVPGMQDADASLLAGSGGGIRRGLLITHPRPQRLANEATCRGARAEPVGRREPDRPVRVRPRGCAEIRSWVARDLDQCRASKSAGDSTLKPRSRSVYKVNALEHTGAPCR
jgi:hypothetical protein